MKPNEIFSYCLSTMDGVVLDNNWGEWGIFYNPEKVLKKGVYILTVKEKDGDKDKSSNLDRDDIYRLNICLKKAAFIKRFGDIPKRPHAGESVDMDFDFTSIDKIMPHPVYAWMGWACVLNPSEKTFEEIKDLIHEAYTFAIEKYEKKKL